MLADPSRLLGRGVATGLGRATGWERLCSAAAKLEQTEGLWWRSRYWMTEPCFCCRNRRMCGRVCLEIRNQTETGGAEDLVIWESVQQTEDLLNVRRLYSVVWGI
jgi:hypothetical protein